MLLRFVLMGVLFSVSACKSKDDDGGEEWQEFVSQYAHVYCDIRSSCDINFEAEFGDQERCRKAVLTNENKGNERRIENGCSFKEDAADECLELAETMSCEEWLAGALDQVCGGALWSCD